MRYNIFNKAHLPLKTALLSSCISISKMLHRESSTLEETLKKVEEVLHIFDEQVAYETLHILPYIFEYEPSVWCNYASEHDKGADLSNELKNLVHLCNRQKRVEDKLRIMAMISERFNEFVLYNFNHMDDEEAVLNEILWRYYQDKVLVMIEEKNNILPHLVKQHEQATGLQTATAA